MVLINIWNYSYQISETLHKQWSVSRPHVLSCMVLFSATWNE